MAEQNLLIAPTQEHVRMAANNATDKALNMASSITGVSGPSGALVRELIPSEDLESGSANSWNGTDRDWVQGGLSADTNNEVYKIDSNQNAQDKVIVFYGLYDTAADVITTEVSFEDGTGATFARYGTESLEIPDVGNFILFDEPVVYGSTEDGQVNQWCDDAGTDQMVYMAKVVEPVGQTVTPRNK